MVYFDDGNQDSFFRTFLVKREWSYERESHEKIAEDKRQSAHGTSIIGQTVLYQYFIVEVTDNKLHLQPLKASGGTWGTTGTADVFLKQDRVYFATLS